MNRDYENKDKNTGGDMNRDNQGQDMEKKGGTGGNQGGDGNRGGGSSSGSNTRR